MTSFLNSYVKYVNHLEQINRAVEQDAKGLVEEVEQFYQETIRSIAGQVARHSYKVALLAGPSGSGKTTTAHFFIEELKKMGFHAVVISMDDFYRGEKQAPLLPNGQYDYESVEALDIAEINRCLYGLVTHGACDMPQFDFALHRPSEQRRHVQLGDRDIAIIEGIHSLNPCFAKQLPQDKLVRIYISVKQGIKDGCGEVLSPEDIRLLRRIVRDHQFRGTMPERTFRMWPSVVDGENKNIRPYKRISDFTINSLHLYEPCLMRQEAIPLLKTVGEEHPYFDRASGLIRRLDRFALLSPQLVPKDSLMREFIGSAGLVR